MGFESCVFLLWGGLMLASAQTIKHFEVGRACGSLSEISMRSKPLDLTDAKGCAFIRLQNPPINEGTNEVEHYRLEDKIYAAYGGWGEWSEWGDCSKTCGSGQKRRVRTCQSDHPDLYCKGSTDSARYCRIVGCPVHGQWTDWSSWDACASDCDKTSESRTRSCTNPAPKYGGDDCAGLSEESRNCTSEAVCPGSWSPWTSWSACSPNIDDCGDGSKTRQRTCDNPAPRNGGALCDGTNQDALKCRIPCGPPGEWNNWGEWAACDNSVCGPGYQYRHRDCSPSPRGEVCPVWDATVEDKKCETDCKAGGFEMTSFHVGDWYHWQHCPNTFQVYQFNIKSHEGMGVTGIQMGCNNPDNGIITSHAFSDGGFPTEFFTCSEGYTSVRVRWVPDGGAFFDDVGVTCFELFCSSSGQWQTPQQCFANGNGWRTSNCPDGTVVCGIRTRAYYHWSDNVGITNVQIECCRLPPEM